MSHAMSHILVVYQVQAVDQVVHLHKQLCTGCTEISMHPVHNCLLTGATHLWLRVLVYDEQKPHTFASLPSAPRGYAALAVGS